MAHFFKKSVYVRTCGPFQYLVSMLSLRPKMQKEKNSDQDRD